MTTLATAIELMKAGYSDRHIAREMHMTPKRVGQIRKRAGLPAARSGPKPIPVEDRFQEIAEPTDDGHMVWPHPSETMRQGRGPKISIRRVAFRISHQREAVGQVLPGCDRDDCVHPDHVEDRAMRDQYRAIFGPLAA